MNARRWVAAGCVIGFVIALAFSLAMPTRYTSTAPLSMRHGKLVAVYGDLGPYAPRSLGAARIEKSPRVVRDSLLGLLAGGLVALTFTTVVPGSLRRRA